MSENDVRAMSYSFDSCDPSQSAVAVYSEEFYSKTFLNNVASPYTLDVDAGLGTEYLRTLIKEVAFHNLTVATTTITVKLLRDGVEVFSVNVSAQDRVLGLCEPSSVSLSKNTVAGDTKFHVPTQSQINTGDDVYGFYEDEKGIFTVEITASTGTIIGNLYLKGERIKKYLETVSA